MDHTALLDGWQTTAMLFSFVIFAFAFEWIPMQIHLRDYPEVVALSARLKVEPDLVVGKLLVLWGWYNLHTTDGRSDLMTADLMDSMLGVAGFCNELQRVGWAEIHDNVPHLNNFGKYNGSGAKRRVQNTARQRTSRERRDKCATVSRTDSDTSATTEQKRTEYKNHGRGTSTKLTADDLRDTAKLLAWQRTQAGKAEPIVSDSEADTIHVLAAAERALREGDNPGALFFSLVKEQRWTFATDADEDRARARLREHRGATARGVTSPAEPVINMAELLAERRRSLSATATEGNCNAA